MNVQVCSSFSVFVAELCVVDGVFAEIVVKNVCIAAMCFVGKLIEFDVNAVLVFATLVNFCDSDDYCGDFDSRLS